MRRHSARTLPREPYVQFCTAFSGLMADIVRSQRGGARTGPWPMIALAEHFAFSRGVSMSSRQLFDDLLAFDQEAVPYCEGISDASAREYARNYMRRLQSRANGM